MPDNAAVLNGPGPSPRERPSTCAQQSGLTPHTVKPERGMQPGSAQHLVRNGHYATTQARDHLESGRGEVQAPAGDERTPVVDPYHDRLAVALVRDPDPGVERQRLVRGGERG